MKITDEAVEKAARFIHERTKEIAPRYGLPIYEDFPSWDDLPEGVQFLAKQVVMELMGNLLIGYVAPAHTPN